MLHMVYNICTKITVYIYAVIIQDLVAVSCGRSPPISSLRTFLKWRVIRQPGTKPDYTADDVDSRKKIYFSDKLKASPGHQSMQTSALHEGEWPVSRSGLFNPKEKPQVRYVALLCLPAGLNLVPKTKILSRNQISFVQPTAKLTAERTQRKLWIF